MAKMLDDGSSTPLYAQLRELLKGQIVDGAFVPGERIPSEDKLNGLYGVSRITIRRALQELVNEGYLVKCPGKGTYVSERLPGTSVSSKVRAKFTQNNDVQSFTEACESNNQRAGAHLMSIEEVEGLDDARAFFGFGNEGRLLRVVRIRTADRTPIMVEENNFPAEAYAFLRSADMRTLHFTTSFCPTAMASRCSPSRATLILRRRPPSLRRISMFPSANHSSALRAAITIPTGRPCTLAGSILWAHGIPSAFNVR